MTSKKCLLKSKAGAAPEHTSVIGLNMLANKKGRIPAISLSTCSKFGHFSLCMANF